MNDLNRAFKEMDFQFFGSGEHGMSIQGMRKVLNNDHFRITFCSSVLRGPWNDAILL